MTRTLICLNLLLYKLRQEFCVEMLLEFALEDCYILRRVQFGLTLHFALMSLAVTFCSVKNARLIYKPVQFFPSNRYPTGH